MHTIKVILSSLIYGYLWPHRLGVDQILLTTRVGCQHESAARMSGKSAMTAPYRSR